MNPAPNAATQTRAPSSILPSSTASWSAGGGDRGCGGVPVAIDIVEELIFAEVEYHANHLADPKIGLMRDQEIKILRRKTMRAKRLPDDLGKPSDRVLEKVLPFHPRKDRWPLANEHLGSQAVTAGGAFELEFFGIFTFRMELSRENSPFRIGLRCDHGRCRSVTGDNRDIVTASRDVFTTINWLPPPGKGPRDMRRSETSAPSHARSLARMIILR